MSKHNILRADFGKNIRRIRECKNLTQEQLAELSELHPTYISSMERGKRNPTLISIYKIATALECSIPTLFNGIRIA